MCLLPISKSLDVAKDFYLFVEKLEKALMKVTVSTGRQWKLEIKEVGMDKSYL